MKRKINLKYLKCKEAYLDGFEEGFLERIIWRRKASILRVIRMVLVTLFVSQ